MFTINDSTLKKLLYASFAIYALAVLLGIGFHEPWRDEAQSWLVVKNLDFAGIFKKLPSEGHPPSWYMVLFPFAKLGFPYAVQNWIAALLMIATVYILQFKTALHPAIKILIPFSYLFFFEYSLIARNYCLAAFLVAVLIWLYPKRFDKPWLFALCVVALFNTHMIIFTLCATITALYLLDAIQVKKLNGNVTGNFVLMAVGGLYLIPYIVYSDVNAVFEPFVANHNEHMMKAIGRGLLASEDMQGIAVLLLIAICIGFLNNYKALLIVIGGTSGVLYILGYKFAGDTRHAGIMFLAVLFAYGVAHDYRAATENKNNLLRNISKYSPFLLVLAILLQMPMAFKYYMNDREYVYSDSKNAAEFLKDNHLENSIITGHFAWAASALLPYMEDGRTFYYVECQRYGSYYVFDSCFIKQNWNLPPGEYIQQIYDRFKPDLDKVVMIFNYPLSWELAQRLDNIYKTSENTIREDEMYYMYKFRTNVNSQQQQ